MPALDHSARNPGTLFPPYLQLGSSGPAVLVLQLILRCFEIGRHNIEMDGVFGQMTEWGVKNLQSGLLGFTGTNIDGCFGPTTRGRLNQLYGIDVEALMAKDFEGGTRWTYDGEMQESVWPVPLSVVAGRALTEQLGQGRPAEEAPIDA